jgi:predicted neutral ceramidase superfamily lipid hydrolase
MADGYRGLVGAFPYAARKSDSWLFRSYVGVSALVALTVALLVGFGLVVLIANTARFAGGSLTLSRSFYVVVGLLVVLPVVAPTLLVARRHRRGTARGRRTDALLALSGYVYVFTLYVGLVVTVPPGQQTPPTGALAPVIVFLYGLPQLAGLVPPLVGAGLLYLVSRVTR